MLETVLAAMLVALKALARRFEGRRNRPYLCPAGVPTQGYGHTGPEVKLAGPAWSDDKCEQVLDSDVRLYARAAANLSPVLVQSPERWAAIADFCFNLGNARYKSSTLRRKVNAGDWAGAEEQLGKWVWGGGKRLPGLVLRRAAEVALMRQGRAGLPARPAPSSGPPGVPLEPVVYRRSARAVAGAAEDLAERLRVSSGL